MISTMMTGFISSLARATFTQAPMLNSIVQVISAGVSLIGSFLIVYGGVKLGLAIKDQQGGNAMAEAISTIVGGAVVVVAATYFNSLV